MRSFPVPAFGRAARLAQFAVVGAAGALAVSSAPASAALPDGFAGISAEDVYVGADAYAAKEFGRQRATGFTLTRQVFKWNELEPGAGIYDFSATDRFVLGAARARVRVMPLLYGEPSWGTSRPAGNLDRVTYPPSDYEAYGRFAEAVAKRYGPGGSLWAANPSVAPVPVLQYQLWNEPNLGLYWGGRPNARDYSRLMIAGSKGLRRAQPSAYVVSAGVPESKIGVSPRTFVATMLENGGAASINAIGVHPSGTTAEKLVTSVQKFRTTVNKVGAKKLGLWVTEFGWAVGGPVSKGKTVKPNQQAELIKGTYRGLAKIRKKTNVKGAIYFSWRDSPIYPGITDFWGLHTGLVDLNGKDRPALAKLAKALPAIK